MPKLASDGRTQQKRLSICPKIQRIVSVEMTGRFIVYAFRFL